MDDESGDDEKDELTSGIGIIFVAHVIIGHLIVHGHPVDVTSVSL